jgi:hypothetical protein
MANRGWSSGGKIYSMHTMPVLIDCNFIVDSTNGNGLGIRSLKGPSVANVFMNTSAPLAGSGNPNPGAGGIVVQLQDNYNRSLSGFSSIVSPLSGSPLTSVTAGTTYVIVSLGTASLAQWQAVGLPSGFAPAIGAAFVATASQSIGGSAAVEIVASAGSNITDIETVGDPNQTIAPSGTPGLGAQIVLQCYKNGVQAAPANGSVISLAFYLSNSSVQVQGE